MSKEKKILFIGGGFTKQISNIVEKDSFDIPTITVKDLTSYNTGILQKQAKNLETYISEEEELKEKESWEKLVGQIKKNKKINNKTKQRLLKHVNSIYSDTFGLNYGISPTCTDDKHREVVATVIALIEEFMKKYGFQVIMTTNHDFTLDHWLLAGWDNYSDLLKKNSKLFGFDFSTDDYFFKTPDCFTEDYFSYKAYKKETTIDGNFHFLKLHGALNWWGDDNGSFFSTEKLPQWKGGKSIRSYIPGFPQKYLMGPNKEKYYKQWPYSKILDEARAQLSGAEEIVFYGFGFGDADNALAKELFGEGKFNKEINIIDINSHCSIEGNGFSQHEARVKEWFKDTGFNGKIKVGYPKSETLEYETAKKEIQL